MTFKDRIAIRLAARYVDQLREQNTDIPEDIGFSMFCTLSDALIAVSDRELLQLLGLGDEMP